MASSKKAAAKKAAARKRSKQRSGLKAQRQADAAFYSSKAGQRLTGLSAKQSKSVSSKLTAQSKSGG